MAWETEEREVADETVEVWAWQDDTPEVAHLVYRIDKGAARVEFFPKPGQELEFLGVVTLEGFTSLPREFKPAGYIPSAGYYLDKKLREAKVESLTIVRYGEDSFRKVRNQDAYRVILTYESFQQLKGGLQQINNEAKAERRLFANDHFKSVFPTRFTSSGASDRRRARRVIRNLDPAVIAQFSPDDVEKLLDFFEEFLSEKYTAVGKRRKLLSAAKVKVDEVALSDVIERFEALLESNPLEAKWGEFLRRNLFLVESRYIAVIPELNVVLGGQRKVDFGMVDAQGYLDLFEIKRPSTKLLGKNKDRGNYYWHSDAAKAIAQAEKYLFEAERKGANLQEDIGRQRQVPVQVVRPRAVIIMGARDQLVDEDRAQDFRILRQSLKHIEIVLYDELLERLENQKGKLYLDNV